MKPEESAMLARDRAALRELLSGARDGPVVIARSNAYDIEAVVKPSFFSRLAIACRYVLVTLGALVPICPVKVIFYRLAGVKIGSRVCISPGVVMDPLYPSLIQLDDGCCLGMGCRLLTHEYTATSFRAGRIRIGKDSVIGAYAMIRSGVSVGCKATVGAMSFVNRDVPDGETVAGVPARPLGRSREEAT